jgi:protein gp37
MPGTSSQPCRTSSHRSGCENGRTSVDDRGHWYEPPFFYFGDRVSKVGGDYRFDGEIRGVVTKLSGALRYVVEDDRGVLHVFSAKQLVHHRDEPPAKAGEHAVSGWVHDFINRRTEAENQLHKAAAGQRPPPDPAECLPVPNVGNRRRVFIQSMSDLFDLEVPLAWFAEGWQLIEACDRLAIQIVTKRVTAVEKRLKAIGRTTWLQHAGLIITVVNQDEADRDIPRLLALKARLGIPWVGLSIEPMLGRIALRPEWLAELDWIIAGGESGPHARPMHPDWARGLRDQCAAANVPFFFKQWGEWKNGSDFAPDAKVVLYDGRVCEPDRRSLLAADRVEPLPPRHPTMMRRVGKKAAGRLLDGRTHDAFPTDRCPLPTAEPA